VKFIKSNLDPIIITICGTDYPALLSFRALTELEELTGEGFNITMNKFAVGDYSPSDILKVVFVSLKGGGVDVVYDDLLSIDYSTELMTHLTQKTTDLFLRHAGINDMGKDEDDDKKKQTTKKTI